MYSSKPCAQRPTLSSAQGSGERASERVGGGTHDDAPPDPQVRLLIQPDLDLRLALQVAEDQVLRTAPRVSQAKLAPCRRPEPEEGARTIGCVMIFWRPDMVGAAVGLGSTSATSARPNY